MQISASSFTSQPETGKPVWQVTHIVNLGRKLRTNKHGGEFVVRKVLLCLWRKKRYGDLATLCGVIDFSMGPTSNMRRLLEAIGIADLPKDGEVIKDEKGFLAFIGGAVKTHRPGIRIEATIGHGHMNIKSVEPAEPWSDCGEQPLSALASAIYMRYTQKEYDDGKKADGRTEEGQKATGNADSGGRVADQGGGKKESSDPGISCSVEGIDGLCERFAKGDDTWERMTNLTDGRGTKTGGVGGKTSDPFIEHLLENADVRAFIKRSEKGSGVLWVRTTLPSNAVTDSYER